MLLLWRSFPWLVHCRFGVCRDGSYFFMFFLLDFFLSESMSICCDGPRHSHCGNGVLSGQKNWQPHWKRLLPLQTSKGLGLSFFGFQKDVVDDVSSAFQTARIFSNRGRAIAKKSPGLVLGRFQVDRANNKNSSLEKHFVD